MKKNTKPRSVEFLDNLKQEYLTTEISLSDLSRKYNTDAFYQLKKLGVPFRNKGFQHSLTRTNKIKLNWNCKKITNEKEAYIIGLLMADGWVGKDQLGLRLKESDKALMEQVKNYFSESIKLQYYKNSYSFVVSSQRVCDNISNLGVLHHKTKLELSIPFMEKDLIRHFVRGFFDGDGSIFLCKTVNNCYFKANICSPTINILKEIQDDLNDNNILTVINRENRKGKTLKVPQGTCIATSDMYRLFIRRKSEIEKFYKYLYNNASIYLDRKKEIFDNNLELLKYKRNHVNTELTK